MKKLFFVLCCLIIVTKGFSEEPSYIKTLVEPMSIYQSNYFIAGDKQDQVKFRISAKYNLFYPSDIGLYAGYTQQTMWQVYDGHDTMRTMYQPEVFYRFTSGANIFKDFVIPYIDYIQIAPFYHCSTGVEGDNHRSVNEYYGQIQASIGKVYNFGVNVKGFKYYTINAKNKDINDYRHNYTADFFFKLKSKKIAYLDKEEVHCLIGGNPTGKGFVQADVVFRILTVYVQPKFYIQYFHGFDEDMTEYNVKTNAVRAGFIFTN